MERDLESARMMCLNLFTKCTQQLVKSGEIAPFHLVITPERVRDLMIIPKGKEGQNDAARQVREAIERLQAIAVFTVMDTFYTDSSLITDKDALKEINRIGIQAAAKAGLCVPKDVLMGMFEPRKGEYSCMRQFYHYGEDRAVILDDFTIEEMEGGAGRMAGFFKPPISIEEIINEQFKGAV